MVRIPGALHGAGLKAKMLLQVHDELIFEAPIKEVSKCAELVKEIMEKASLPALELTVPLTVDTGSAKNWAVNTQSFNVSVPRFKMPPPN